MAVSVSELHIDPELDALLRHHSEQEEQEFRKDVERDGKFIDPILYWFDGTKPTIIDGHRRYKLWSRIGKSSAVQPPTTQEISLPDRDAVKRWMIRHQLGRRNLTRMEFDLLLGRLYQQEKTGNKGDGNVSERLAAEFQVSQRTVKRNGKLAEAIDKIADAAPDVAADISNGKLKPSKPVLMQVADAPPTKVKEVVEKLREPKAQKQPKPPKNGSAVSVAVLIDEIKAAFAKVAVRNLEKVAELNGGKGVVYDNARRHLEEFHKLLKDLREGFQ